MTLVSTNSIIGLTKDKKLEAKFIDNAIKFWKEPFLPELTKIMKKINYGWRKNPE